MLNEFDEWLEAKYLSKKVRGDRWAWNFGIQKQRPFAIRENRQWKPAVAYCRYADDFVIIVKGNKAHAEAIREECRAFLEGELKLTLNMGKTHVTHVDDGWDIASFANGGHGARCALSRRYPRTSSEPLHRGWFENCRVTIA